MIVDTFDGRIIDHEKGRSDREVASLAR